MSKPSTASGLRWHRPPEPIGSNITKLHRRPPAYEPGFFPLVLTALAFGFAACQPSFRTSACAPPRAPRSLESLLRFSLSVPITRRLSHAAYALFQTD